MITICDLPRSTPDATLQSQGLFDTTQGSENYPAVDLADDISANTPDHPLQSQSLFGSTHLPNEESSHKQTHSSPVSTSGTPHTCPNISLIMPDPQDEAIKTLVSESMLPPEEEEPTQQDQHLITSLQQQLVASRQEASKLKAENDSLCAKTRELKIRLQLQCQPLASDQNNTRMTRPE